MKKEPLPSRQQNTPGTAPSRQPDTYLPRLKKVTPAMRDMDLAKYFFQKRVSEKGAFDLQTLDDLPAVKLTEDYFETDSSSRAIVEDMTPEGLNLVLYATKTWMENDGVEADKHTNILYPELYPGATKFLAVIDGLDHLTKQLDQNDLCKIHELYTLTVARGHCGPEELAALLPKQE